MIGFMAADRLRIGFLLDEQWHFLRGEMETSKRPALLALARVLNETSTPYAIIGGIALQVHREDPRTTVDIDLAVAALDGIPRDELEAAGFNFTGRFVHSENWRGPGDVPIQFTEDPALRPALDRAVNVDLEGTHIRVIGAADLLHEKLRAGSDPARRRSKRLQDLADAEGLVEEMPQLEAELSDSERAILAGVPPR